jgi:hypothetical protein
MTGYAFHPDAAMPHISAPIVVASDLVPASLDKDGYHMQGESFGL